jgi:hypothetical protein
VWYSHPGVVFHRSASIAIAVQGRRNGAVSRRFPFPSVRLTDSAPIPAGLSTRLFEALNSSMRPEKPDSITNSMRRWSPLGRATAGAYDSHHPAPRLLRCDGVRQTVFEYQRPCLTGSAGGACDNRELGRSQAFVQRIRDGRHASTRVLWRSEETKNGSGSRAAAFDS